MEGFFWEKGILDWLLGGSDWTREGGTYEPAFLSAIVRGVDEYQRDQSKR